MQTDTERIKECNICYEVKPLLDFYFRSDRKKYYPYCKRCKLDGRKVPPKIELDIKLCKKCKIEKNITEFKPKNLVCKSCIKLYKKTYYEVNKEKINSICKEYYKNNTAQIKNKAKEFRHNNPTIIKNSKSKYYIENKDYINEWKRKHIEANREAYSEKWKIMRVKRKDKIKEYIKKRMNEDMAYRLGKNIRSRVRWALKNANTSKSQSTEKVLGCTLKYFKVYFESLFTEGMSWDVFLQGGIHIDHKTPCAHFDLSNVGEQLKCFHYSNLQPLFKIDNLRKSTKTMEQWKQMTA